MDPIGVEERIREGEARSTLARQQSLQRKWESQQGAYLPRESGDGENLSLATIFSDTLERLSTEKLCRR